MLCQNPTSQVDFALDSLLGDGKFEMNCLHRHPHRNGRLTSIISFFYVQSRTWLWFDPNNLLRPFLRCIFDALRLIHPSFSWCNFLSLQWDFYLVIFPSHESSLDIVIDYNINWPLFQLFIFLYWLQWCVFYPIHSNCTCCSNPFLSQGSFNWGFAKKLSFMKW